MTISIVCGIMIENDVGGNVMKFYGVGVKLGATTENPINILDECIERDIWYMGFKEGEKENYEDIISHIKVGDIIFAKSLHQATKEQMKIKAVGFVTDKMIPDEFRVNQCIAVYWFKRFEPYVNLKYMGINFITGINRRNTIFEETDDRIIKQIIRLSKGGHYEN